FRDEGFECGDLFGGELRLSILAWVTFLSLEVWPSGPVYHNGGAVPRDFRGMTIFTGGQLDLINVRADFLDRIINSVMILHMGLRALDRLGRQVYIPISHHRLLSKGEYTSRHQAVSSLKDTGPLFPRLITATGIIITTGIIILTIDIGESFDFTIHRECFNFDRVPDHTRMHELHFARRGELAFRNDLTNASAPIKHVQNKCLTWRHLRSVLDSDRITLNGHIVFTVNKFEHISISRF